MEKKNVKCPSCGVVLEVKNSMNEPVKIITCPQCGTSLRVKFQQQTENEPLDARTYLANGGGNETQIAMGNYVGGKVFVVCEGNSYELHEGRNVIGRKAKSSVADTQLDVNDRYMSRENALVKVYKTPTPPFSARAIAISCSVTVSIACYKNLNPIFLGKKELKKEDELILSDGDEFTMGTTKMTIKIE